MRRRFGIAVLVAVLGVLVFVGWKMERVLPLPPRPQADLGTVKSDLFVFARAERAFFASSGHYAPMTELRTNGLLSLPPDTRWPYRYSIVVTAPDTFLIMAMSQNLDRARPAALAIDEQMNMREFHPPSRFHRRQDRKPSVQI
jgi:hypothetical protein